ncbi:MFS transporter [Cryptosporangium aurantiacum]|uniref:MFS transporter, AAHS family, benzoate transport protein n=1 Tax=Cryptosporangium aurantiacum TaxID=134849 RepID=A0A1M7RE69_9ACTN|nr:aromatic acid/H+ symport family MFS transporter [Cryptosporangium aurantiacum]SHN44524.1 MFS transporter, AAHS family, benzoate transport protein [Cryptosporangium aurantiacum]
MALTRLDRVARTVLSLCWVVVLLEGFDLFVYSTVIPELLDDPEWQLTASEAGRIGSYATFGMLIGSLTIGTVTDWIGRRKAIIGCATWFSVLMAVCAVAPNPAVFGFGRFLAGLGLGGLIPTAMPLVMEYIGEHRRGAGATWMMTGYHVGGLVVAALAIAVLPAFGWRAMFWAGALPIVVMLPLLWRYLPESVDFLLARGRTAEAEAVARRHHVDLDAARARVGDDVHTEDKSAGIRTIFGHGYLASTLLFFVASFCGLLLVYGFGTWLPELMRDSGYGLGSALSFLVVTNIGAVAGLLLTGPLADRLGTKRASAIWFLTGAVFVGLISIRMPSALIYLAAALAGFFLFTAQVVLYAHVGYHYPTATHATALGWIAGVGRIGSVVGPTLGGVLLDADAGVWSFYVFALAGLVGAVAMWLAPRSPLEAPPRARWSPRGRAGSPKPA